jgi:SAM-dependent methyltransferase
LIEITFRKHIFIPKVLDLGCGPGNIALPLASIGLDVLAVDINRDALHYLNRKNIFSNVSFLCASVESLSLKEKFDVIICAEIFEHLHRPNRLSKVLTTLLNNDGIIIITIPNGFGPWELLSELPRRLLLNFYYKCKGKKPPVGIAHCQNFTLRSFRNLLNSNEIIVERIYNTDFLSWLPGLNKSIFAYLDCKIADLLPHFIVSGWVLVCRKADFKKNSIY